MPALPTTPVWDLFVRLFHWSLVCAIGLNYFVLDDGKTLHQWIGYAALALVAARIVWGFVGSRHARFSDFVPTPRQVRDQVRHLVRGRTEVYLGHNPLGSLMILALLALVLALGSTGWMQTLDRFWGEEWLQELHEILGTTLIAFAGLHALAAVVMGRLERTRLVKAMFTGVKERW
nr:cytochrome b/b6 domain-containing protein [uncultured Albidiferax sp.]